MSKHFVLPAFLLVLFGLLGGCAARPGPELLAPLAQPVSTQRQVELTVATDREPDVKNAGNFTNNRSYCLHFAHYVISIPPNHKTSGIEWSPSHVGDPTRSFTTLSYTPLPDNYLTAEREGEALNNATASPDAARTAVHTQPEQPVLSAMPGAPGLPDQEAPDQKSLAVQASLPDPAPAKSPGQETGQGEADKHDAGSVVVFVHGYNTNYAESVLRMAQLLADNPSTGEAILFAWPSDGSLSGYVADKDAATFARDHLVRLITALANDPRHRDITLMAHSMGCWLTMEALRELRLTGQGRVLDRLGAVILAAPDIDLDVFRAQAQVVGRLEPPITVLASPDDRALEISTRLGGGRDRVGGLDVRDPRIQELASAYGVQLIDISNMAATDSLNHDRFIGAATALRNTLSPKKSANPIRKAGAYVLDAVAAVLETPGRIGRAAADRVQ